MQGLFELFKKLLPLAVKSQAMLDIVMSVVAFLEANPALVDSVLAWVNGAFSGTADGEDVPEGTEPIRAELKSIREAQADCCPDGDDCDPDCDKEQTEG